MRLHSLRGGADVDLEPIAERVMRDLSDQVRVTTVITVLRQCAARYRGATPEFIERATRNQLSSCNSSLDLGTPG